MPEYPGCRRCQCPCTRCIVATGGGNRRPNLTRLALLLVLVALGSASAQQPDALLAPGQAFVLTLKLDQRADAKIFRETGMERSRALLMAVISHGQEPTATFADWVSLHRGTSGIVEFCIENGELFKAAIFAQLNDGFYRNLDHDYNKALQQSELSLDLQRRSGLAGTLDVAISAVGRDYLSLGRAEEALRYFDEARHANQETSGNRAARNWRDIVSADIALKRMDDARREVGQFVEAARTSPAPFKAVAYLAQSDLLVEEAKFDPAINSIRNARDAMLGDPSAAEFDWEVVNQLMSCVLASMESLPYKNAITLAQLIDTEFTALPIPVTAFARQAVVVRRRMAGEIDAVLREQTADFDAAKAARNVGGQIVALRGIAATYRYSNGIHNQITALEQAVELDRSLVNYPDPLFEDLNNLGDAYLDAHEPGTASRCFDEVTRGIDALTDATSRKRLAKRYGSALLGKARFAQMDEDPDTAREILAGALTPKPGGPAEYAREDVLLQVARLERDLGERPDAAAKDYEETIARYRDQKNNRNETAYRLEYARFLITSRAVEKLPNALREAEAQLTTASSAIDSLQLADEEWRVQFERGELEEARLDPEAAIQSYKNAIALLDRLRAGLTQQDQRQSLVDNDTVQDLYRRLIALLSAGDRQTEAWQYIERARARSFLEALGGRRFLSGEDTPALRDLADIEKRIVGLRTQLAPDNESVLRGAGKEPALMKNELHDLETKYAFARQQAALSATRGGQALAIDPLPLKELIRLVPADTALIEYALLNGKITAIVAGGGKSRQFTWEVNTTQLRGNVLRLRSLLADEHSGEQLQPLLDLVSAALVTPITKGLPPATRKLLIVPSGVLNYLPFQTLSTPDGRPLIEQFAITYLPSASSLRFLRQQDKFSGDLFLGTLGNVSVDGWAPLPGTLREADGIARVLPRAVRLSETAFTHDAAKQALLEHTEVHFATHGYLDEQSPLFSAVLTSPAAGQPSRLSLYEIMQLPLRARLVVLSACETGLGKLLGGDEVSGLTRTFLLAGANTVVSSLWKVSDDSTALLMQGFYQRMRSGETSGQALRESALEVRKQYPHPFYWAPFIVTGAR